MPDTRRTLVVEGLRLAYSRSQRQKPLPPARKTYSFDPETYGIMPNRSHTSAPSLSGSGSSSLRDQIQVLLTVDPDAASTLSAFVRGLLARARAKHPEWFEWDDEARAGD